MARQKDNKIYWVWASMKQRCFDRNKSDYHRYGGRGITVCKRWLEFKNFEEDMKIGYKKGLTLDRINNDEDYSRNNCRWATQKQQANNRRSNRVVYFKGKSKTLTQWIEFFDLKPSTVRQRFYAYKWDLEDCFIT